MPAFGWKKIITNADDADYKNDSIEAGDLPIATGSAVGAVKIGSGVTLGMDGTISVASGSDTTNSSMAFATGTGVLTLTDSASGAVSVDLDGRYADSSVTGVTNLGIAKSGTAIDITSDTGSDVSIGLADGTNAGLISPAKNTQIATNKANITTLTTATNLNTAKTGITSAQASAISTNSAKTGITSAQASAISTNSAKTGITSAQASAISTNSGKTGITSAQASAISTNSGKVTNVSTSLGYTAGTTTGTITSDGSSATIPLADATNAGLIDKDKYAMIASNKVASTNNATAIATNTTAIATNATAIGLNTSKVSCDETSVKSVLSNLDSSDTLNIGDSGNDTTININGNLNVSGTTTTINTTNLAVADSVIELNSDYTGSTPTGTQGVTVNRGSATGGDASLIWSESSYRWEFDFNSSKNPVAFVDIATGTTPGSGTQSWGVGSMAIDSSGDFYIRTS